MKRYAIAACLALPLLAGGCNFGSTSATVQTIEQVAQKVLGSGALPLACQIFAQAELYFNAKKAVNSANNISVGTAAAAIATGICPPNPPPTNLSAALTDLNAAWVALQAATTVPATPPTPTPTSN
jgi:hypothetical protein